MSSQADPLNIYRSTIAVMGTIATIQVVEPAPDTPGKIDPEERVERAWQWFRDIEECCTRFDPLSEVMQLAARPGVPVAVSAMLFEAVQFALACAEHSGGGFDPTVGYAMESLGFNREYRTGRIVRTAIDAGPVSYRDVQLDAQRKTITLLRPLILDLGAVAKGLAIDMAARELQAFENFSIDAGGDLYLGGHNPYGAPWRIGIRHPREPEELIACVQVSNCSVCTSGDYERRIVSDSEVHHILDPRTGRSATGAVSATVIAPNAMLADALSTAAFVLGPEDGIQLLTRMNADGLLISPDLQEYATPGMYREYQLSGPALFPNA